MTADEGYPTARRAAAVFISAALCAVGTAGIGLALDWRAQGGDIGMAVRSGYGAAPEVVFVAGALALVLLVIGRWRPDVPAWSGVAAAASAIGALGCIGGLSADGAATSGPAPWIGLFALATAALLALCACLAGARASQQAPP